LTHSGRLTSDTSAALYTGLVGELTQQNLVGLVVGGVERDEDEDDGRDVDENADDEAEADTTSPASTLEHHAIVDRNRVAR